MTDQNTSEILHMGLESLTQDAKATEDYAKHTEAFCGIFGFLFAPVVLRKKLAMRGNWRF